MAGTKRPHPDTVVGQLPPKKQRLHAQRIPPNAEIGTQDAGMQLMRSIGAALTMAGFDSVKPTALEMFRAHTEEYMLQFASHVRTSMHGQRRIKPTAHDFAMALSSTSNARTASLLAPQLRLPIPETISYPSIPEPNHHPAPAPDFSALLQPLISVRAPPHIPSHFPALPSQHAWKETAVFPSHKKDARQMREKATEEGLLAEQALRRLAAAAKAGAAKTETRRRTGTVLSGIGKIRDGTTRSKAAGDSIFEDVLRDMDTMEGRGDSGLGLDGLSDAKEGARAFEFSDGVAVNYEVGYRRRGGSRR